MFKIISKSILVYGLITSAAQAADACNRLICIYSNMPILSQSSDSLRKHINKVEGLDVERDPGWCGMVSSAMFLNAIANERGPTSSMPAFWTKATVSNDYIHKAGKLVETNFEEGGTFTSKASNGFSSIRDTSRLNNLGTKLGDAIPRGAYFYNPNGVATANDLYEKIKSTKAAFYILVGKYKNNLSFSLKYDCKKNSVFGFCLPKISQSVSYERLGGHIMVVNGYFGPGLFRVHDPWGRIYYVTLAEKDVELRGVEKKSLQFQHAIGESGFAQSGGLNNTLLLESYVGWSLLKEAPFVLKSETESFKKPTAGVAKPVASVPKS